MIFKKLFKNTSVIFKECSSLTSLNLSNFNTNNDRRMYDDIFTYLNKNCNVITLDKNLLEELK